MIQNQLVSDSPLTDFLFKKSGMMKIPLSGTFELTPTCNFSCRMCYIRKTEGEVCSSPRSRMNLKQWIKIAEDACNMGMLNLLLTGGEPTIWGDFWQLYEELCRMGILISINTNGSLLTNESINRLVNNPPKRINLTLYGASDRTYQELCNVQNVYSKVDEAITELENAGIQVKLNCSLTPWNVHDLEAMARYAGDKKLILDVSSYMFPPIRRDLSMVGKNDRFTPYEAAKYRILAYRLQHDTSAYQRYLRNISEGSIPPPGLDENCIDPMDGQVKCRAGKASFWITWDGYMMPCGMMTEPKTDVQTQPFRNAWEEIVKLSNEIKLSGVCGSCKNMMICHSCAAMAQTETGSVSGIPRYLCEMVDAMKHIADEELQQMDTQQK